MSQYRAYPAYKDSGIEWIGQVPEHWQVKRLKHLISQCQNGVWGDDPLEDGSDTLCIRVADFDRDNNVVIYNPSTYRQITKEHQDSRLVSKGDILLEKSGGGAQTLVGANVRYLGEEPAVCSNFVAVIKPSKMAESAWLNYLMASMYALKINLRSIKQSTGIQNLDSEQYLDEGVAAPSLDEQATIAAALDRETARIDALVEKKTRFIELLKEKRQALITHAVTKGLDPNVKMKDSGIEWIGQVPEHWKIAQIKRISALNPRKSTLSEEKDSLCTFLPMEKLRTNAVTLDETRPIHEVYGGYSYFSDGDILIAKVTPCFENGNIAVANGLVNGIGFGSTEINVLRVNGKGHNRFLYYRLQEEQFRTIAKSEMRGTGGLKRVPTELFESFTFGLPDTDEQVTIAAALDRETARIDALIEKKNRFIELLKEKRQALITHAVTKGLDPNVKMKDSGVEWIGQVPEHWAIPALKFLLSTPITDGPHETPVPAEPQDGIVFISAEAVSSGRINFSKAWGYISRADHKRYSRKYKPQQGDIYMVKSGATTGITAMVEDNREFNIWSPLAAIRANSETAPKFLLYALRSTEFQAGVALNWSYGTQQNIGMNVLENLPLPIPPYKEQATIAATLERETARIDALIGKAEQSITLLKERRSAFITAAVTGQIDLRGKQ